MLFLEIYLEDNERKLGFRR